MACASIAPDRRAAPRDKKKAPEPGLSVAMRPVCACRHWFLEPAWFVPGPTLPWLEGLAELDFVFAPVVMPEPEFIPDLLFISLVADDLWCLCVLACTVGIGLANPAITSAATAHLILVMEGSPLVR
jgi:hypothetical protein